MKLAILFPGQGSQTVGMGKELFDSNLAIKAIFDQADKLFANNEVWQSQKHAAISHLCFNGPEEKLKLTEITQPSILLTSYAAWLAFKEFGLPVEMFAGHSLGEFTALVASGALSLEAALELVFFRGYYMQDAVPVGTGKMVVVIGLDSDKVNEICINVSNTFTNNDVCQVANFNSPVQTAVSGTKAGVELAEPAFKEAGAKRVLELPVSAPFHCVLMQPAADKLLPKLEAIQFKPTATNVVANLTARNYPLDQNQYSEYLYKQIVSPVRWVETMEFMAEVGITHCVELGPGKVLSGLGERISPSIKFFNASTPAEIDKILLLLKEAN